jgi:hypothetical protein
MVARILQASEWHRLKETGLDLELWSQLEPSSVHIVIVEDAGQIVACWATFAVRHVEGFWVRPDHQKRGGALRRLFVGMRALLTELGSSFAVTQAETPEIAALLTAAGASRVPGESYTLPVAFGPWARKV